MASPESGDKNTVEISRYEKERMAGVCIKEEEEIRGNDDADMDVIAAVLDNAIATVEVCELVVEGVSDAPPSTPGSGEVVSAGGAGDPQRDACAPCSPVAVPTCLRSVMLTNQDAREFLNKLVARRVEDFLTTDPKCELAQLRRRISNLEDDVDYWREIATRLGKEVAALRGHRGNPCSTSRLRTMKPMVADDEHKSIRRTSKSAGPRQLSSLVSRLHSRLGRPAASDRLRPRSPHVGAPPPADDGARVVDTNARTDAAAAAVVQRRLVTRAYDRDGSLPVRERTLQGRMIATRHRKGRGGSWTVDKDRDQVGKWVSNPDVKGSLSKMNPNKKRALKCEVCGTSELKTVSCHYGHVSCNGCRKFYRMVFFYKRGNLRCQQNNDCDFVANKCTLCRFRHCYRIFGDISHYSRCTMKHMKPSDISNLLSDEVTVRWEPKSSSGVLRKEMKPNAARAEQPAAGAGTAPAAAALRMIIKRKRGRPRKYLYFADEHVGGATDEGRASRRNSELLQEQRTVSPSRSTAIAEGGETTDDDEEEEEEEEAAAEEEAEEEEVEKQEEEGVRWGRLDEPEPYSVQQEQQQQQPSLPPASGRGRGRGRRRGRRGRGGSRRRSGSLRTRGAKRAPPAEAASGESASKRSRLTRSAKLEPVAELVVAPPRGGGGVDDDVTMRPRVAAAAGSRRSGLPRKPPMSPFMRYSRKVFDVIRASNRALSYSEIAKSTGQLWSELTDEEKKPYVDEYEEEKIKYDNERMRMGYRESVDPSVQRATKTVWSREHARHAVVAGSFPHHERRYENRSTAVAAASRTDQRADGDQWTSNVNGRASPSKQPASVFDQAASSSAEVLTIDQLESSVDEQVSRIDNSSSASEETLSASERLTSCTDEQIVTIDRRALSDGDKQNSVEELSSAEDERVSTVRQVESTIDEEMLTIDHDASTSDGRMLDDNVPDESSCISDKPLTPYLKFSTEVLDSVKEQYPHYKMVLVLDRIRTMWEELTPVQKLVYYEESGVEAEKNKLDSTNVLGAPAGALKEYTEVEEIELVSHALTASEGQLVELHSPANGQAQVSTVSTPLATVLAHASVPPQPWIMGVSAMQKGLIISWNLRVEDSHLPIAGYQLYASKQGSLVPPSVEAWRLVSRVDALPLPMACAVSHGRTNSRYYFAVRALDTSGRCGPFSRPYCVEYSLK